MKRTDLISMLKFGTLTAILFAAMPEMASAADSLNELTHSFSSQQMVALPYILSAVCYVGGAFMLVSGALKLKAHAESPNEKLAPGVARLLTGGLITSVPALTKLVQNTTTLGQSGQASFTTFTVTF